MCKSALPRFGFLLTTLGFLAFCFAQVQTTGAAFGGTSKNTPDLCVEAARSAADQTGIPLAILMAITLTETGRTSDGGLRPWPWAVNQAGKSYWFSTSGEAVEFAESQLDLGLRNFDVGCFQLNHRWHSKGFISTQDMFDPVNNALYAARFLGDLYLEKGDWSLAAAAYHSRTPEYAEVYKAKFESILAGVSGLTAPEPDTELAPIRANRFPLLQAGMKGNSGSLVPRFYNGTPLLGGQP